MGMTFLTKWVFAQDFLLSLKIISHGIQQSPFTKDHFLNSFPLSKLNRGAINCKNLLEFYKEFPALEEIGDNR